MQQNSCIFHIKVPQLFVKEERCLGYPFHSILQYETFSKCFFPFRLTYTFMLILGVDHVKSSLLCTYIYIYVFFFFKKEFSPLCHFLLYFVGNFTQIPYFPLLKWPKSLIGAIDIVSYFFVETIVLNSPVVAATTATKWCVGQAECTTGHQCLRGWGGVLLYTIREANLRAKIHSNPQFIESFASWKQEVDKLIQFHSLGYKSLNTFTCQERV